MSKRLWVVLLVAALVTIGFAPVSSAQEDVTAYPSCKYCGMDRAKFAHSRMLIEYEDGTTVAECSIHCAALDLALSIDKTPKSLMVGDFDTKKLINAEDAYWVIGGKKMGVMTARAKWAFATKEGAENFIKENGGTLATFDQAMKATFEDMYADSKMIRDKRKMMQMKMKKGMESKDHKM